MSSMMSVRSTGFTRNEGSTEAEAEGRRQSEISLPCERTSAT